jgi:hypothetical protein
MNLDMVNSFQTRSILLASSCHWVLYVFCALKDIKYIGDAYANMEL